MPTTASLDLLARWRDHADQRAAADLVARYLADVLALVRRRIAPQLRPRLDPEDVAQSAFRSFFRTASDRLGDATDDAELWDLLAAITLHKLGHQIEKHVLAARRSVLAESHFGGDDSLHRLGHRAAADRPTPDDVAALADELQRALGRLDAYQRRVAELWLAQASLAETAEQVGTSEKTVQRARERIRVALRRRDDSDR